MFVENDAGNDPQTFPNIKVLINHNLLNFNLTQLTCINWQLTCINLAQIKWSLGNSKFIAYDNLYLYKYYITSKTINRNIFVILFFKWSTNFMNFISSAQQNITAWITVWIVMLWIMHPFLISIAACKIMLSIVQHFLISHN